jgi:signal transduction histidine kinase
MWNNGDTMNRTDQALLEPGEQSPRSTHHLQQGIVQRKAAETALRRSSKQCARLVAKSQRLQQHLQHLTHEKLSAQEEQRLKISHQLQDEIAQTLLGIKVRLEALNAAATSNPAKLRREIASTQRLVTRSAGAFERFARELDLQQRA